MSASCLLTYAASTLTFFFLRSGASNEISSSTFSRIVCRRRAPMFSVCSFTLVAKRATLATASSVIFSLTPSVSRSATYCLMSAFFGSVKMRMKSSSLRDCSSTRMGRRPWSSGIKPSDLIPELQGRLPIRVELQSLKEEDFIRILTEPKNALIKQYVALLETEGVKLNITEDAVAAVARFATSVNEQTENIGARRLHTILEKVLDEISFEAPDLKKKNVKVDAAYVNKQLADIVKNQDLSRYIL